MTTQIIPLLALAVAGQARNTDKWSKSMGWSLMTTCGRVLSRGLRRRSERRVWRDARPSGSG
jgi:hypothetical protein